MKYEFNKWYVQPKHSIIELGLIPHIIYDDGKKSFAELADQNYAHGGGWSPYSTEWKLDFNREDLVKPATLKYPGDPVLKEIARLYSETETFIFFPYALCAVVKLDGAFEVSRMD